MHIMIFIILLSQLNFFLISQNQGAAANTIQQIKKNLLPKVVLACIQVQNNVVEIIYDCHELIVAIN